MQLLFGDVYKSNFGSATSPSLRWKLVIQIQRQMGRAVAHGRYLKTVCLWILRKEERDEQPRRFSCL